MEFARTLTLHSSNNKVLKVYNGHSYKEEKSGFGIKSLTRLMFNRKSLRESSSFQKDDPSTHMKFAKKFSRNASTGRLLGKRVKSLQNKQAELRRAKSLNQKEMRAGLDDQVEDFEEEEEIKIVSTDELHDIIEALAETKDRESEEFAVLNRDNIEKEIETVMEFWRLINAKKPKAAYELVWDDIQSIQNNWDDILPRISSKRVEEKTTASSAIRRTITNTSAKFKRNLTV